MSVEDFSTAENPAEFEAPERDVQIEQEPVIVPADALSADALDALIEEFVTRHGTELSEAQDKVQQVGELLRVGKARIVFDPNTESCNIEGTVVS